MSRVYNWSLLGFCSPSATVGRRATDIVTGGRDDGRPGRRPGRLAGAAAYGGHSCRRAEQDGAAVRGRPAERAAWRGQDRRSRRGRTRLAGSCGFKLGEEEEDGGGEERERDMPDMWDQ